MSRPLRPDGLPDDACLPPELDPRGRGGRRSHRPVDTGGRARSGRRAARRLLAGLLAAVLLLAVVAAAVLVQDDRQMDRVTVPTLGQGRNGDGQNWLLVGSDSREGLTPAQVAQARTGYKGGGSEGTLTDTVELLHIPAGGGRPVLVALPRDSWVEIPGHGRGRLNSAYPLGESTRKGGGPALLVQTVEQLSGLRIDHYVEVGFVAFLRITDALGGVQVDLCSPARDKDAAIDLPAGPQRLSGVNALGFVRQRKGLPRGDLDRAARQQYFLSQAAGQVLSPSTLLRPDRGVRLVGAVTSSLTVDESVSVLTLMRLGLRLRGAAGGGLATAQVPVADPAARRGGAEVVLLDDRRLPGFFAGLDDAGQAPAAPATTATRAPGPRESSAPGPSRTPAPASPTGTRRCVT